MKILPCMLVGEMQLLLFIHFFGRTHRLTVKIQKLLCNPTTLKTVI